MVDKKGQKCLKGYPLVLGQSHDLNKHKFFKDFVTAVNVLIWDSQGIICTIGPLFVYRQLQEMKPISPGYLGLCLCVAAGFPLERIS